VGVCESLGTMGFESALEFLGKKCCLTGVALFLVHVSSTSAVFYLVLRQKVAKDI